VHRIGSRVGGESHLLEHAPRLGGGLLSTVDQPHVLTHRGRQEWFEQRVVRAAEDERVHLAGQEWIEVAVRHEASGLVVQPAFFHQRHE
jgi:hypothetical protein